MVSHKRFLIAGIVVLLVGACIILPIQYSSASYIWDFYLTYFTLGIGLIITMYGLFGEHFFKALTFLLCSIVISICAWLIFFTDNFLSTLLAVWLGAPSGIIAGLIFLFVNYKFLADENRYKLFAKRFISYALILFVVSISFANGSKWWENVADYFKAQNEQPKIY